MYEFNYHRPDSLADAKSIFQGANDGMYLAGGHTLLPAMKQRLSAPSDIIDLAGIKELSGISSEAGKLRIGALTTHAEVAGSAEVRNHAAALCVLAEGIGDAQVRNRGTIAGSLANNDPAADYPAAILGLGATIHTDQRDIEADDYLLGMFETALQPGEVITGVSFPKPDASGYAKFANQASRYATVGVMVAKKSASVRVAITGAGPCAFRATAFEEALSTNFAAGALDGVSIDATNLLSDMHASAEYRAHLCTVMAKQALSSILS